MDEVIKQKVIEVYDWCEKFNQYGCTGKLCLPVKKFNSIKNDLTDIAYYFETVNHIYKEELIRIVNSIGLQYETRMKMAPLIFAQLLTILRVLRHEVTVKKFDWWSYMHPRIVGLCRTKFEIGSYDDTVRTACIEICTTIKNFRNTHGHDYIHSEADMIRATIKKSNSLLSFNDQQTSTEKNIQEGYAKIFDGVIQGIRNEGAHEHIDITEDQAARKLMMLSDLMFMLDIAFARVENPHS